MEDRDSAMPAKTLDKLAKRYGLGPYASRGTSDATSVPLADPGLLEIIGGIAQALGFAEQVQRVLPTERVTSRRRHARIDKRIEAFDTALHDARAALRLVRTTMPSALAGAPSDAIAVSVPLSELPLYRRGLDRLHDALRQMSDSAYELEAIVQDIGSERERFYRISQAGRPVLDALRAALSGDDTAADRGARLDSLLEKIDGYLGACSQRLAERDRWIQQ